MPEPSVDGTIYHRPLCPDGRGVEDLPCDAPCPGGSRPFVLAATILASAMAFIDGTVVTIALPALQQNLDASFSRLQWVVNAYALLLGGLILVGGGLGDRFGRRRIFATGIGIFALASLLCALAPTAEFLIFGRALQGVGAALLVPQSLAIIAASFPKEVRGRAIGIWAGASAITTALGPPIGGVLLDLLDWRAIFWINLPMAAAAIWLTLTHVPESRNDGATGAVDWQGGLVAVTAFGALTVGLTQAAEHGEASALVFVLMGLGLAGVFLFVRVERQATNPLVPGVLFKDPAFTGGNVVTLFLYGALGGVLFLLPFDLIAHRGLSAAEVGLTMLPIGLVIGVFSRFVGHWADGQGPRMPLALGSFLVAVGTAMLALAISDYAVGVLLPILILSAGMAMVVAPLTTAVINAAPDALSGAASGVNNAASRLAGLFAVAIVGGIASFVFQGEADAAQLAGLAGPLRFGELPPPGEANRAVLEAAFLSAYSTAMWAATAGAALAAFLSFIMLKPR